MKRGNSYPKGKADRFGTKRSVQPERFYTESANNFYAIGDNTRGDIMVVHNAILHDHSLQEEIIRQIREDYALESAVLRAFRTYSATLSQIDNEYFSQRAADLDDVAVRLICTILGRPFRRSIWRGSRLS